MSRVTASKILYSLWGVLNFPSIYTYFTVIGKLFVQVISYRKSSFEITVQ